MENKERWKIIESGIGSKGRLRIIKILAKNPEGLSKYMLERLTGIRSKTLSSDLSLLKEIGWVLEETDHVKKFRLNFEDEIVKKILEFFKDLRVF